MTVFEKFIETPSTTNKLCSTTNKLGLEQFKVTHNSLRLAASLELIYYGIGAYF